MNNKLIALKNNFIPNYLILNELNSIRVLKYIFLLLSRSVIHYILSYGCKFREN